MPSFGSPLSGFASEHKLIHEELVARRSVPRSFRVRGNAAVYAACRLD